DTPLRAVHVGVGPTPHLAAVPAEAQAWYWHLTDITLPDENIFCAIAVATSQPSRLRLRIRRFED
ncbi:MAG: hypothetical protein IRZ02_00615, partial [Acidothermus sp.]|nr:hypothetical protein [Acidothermus sp.]